MWALKRSYMYRSQDYQLRNIQTFLLSQSKLETALFGTIFSFELTIPDMDMLLRQDEAKNRLQHPHIQHIL